MAQACAQHPGVNAAFRCEGCTKLLCQDCIKKGHALLFCSQCGERAMPLEAGQPATVKEVTRRQAISKPYSFQEALFYPFRGVGLYMFIATLVSLAFVSFLLQYSRGCYAIVLAVGLWSLMVGLQFKIVRSTAEGEDQLPDWPEYMDWGERLGDIVIYLVVAILQFFPVVAYTLLNMGKVLSPEPSLLFWAGFALFAWLGMALGTVAFGAAGRFDRSSVMRVDLHLKALKIGGVDTVTATNMAFAIGISLFVVRALLQQVPYVGAAVAGVLGAYWTFTSAHLAGVLFRRHILELEKVYE
ncbi:MAG TPA: B-box zinc finger protein [Thermoanaerobaculia bacterium]|nr:B-box zinc finger protein [Thermoanaerobaculia bacterium]